MSRKIKSTFAPFKKTSASIALSNVARRSRKGSFDTYPFVRSSASGSSSTMIHLILISFAPSRHVDRAKGSRDRMRPRFRCLAGVDPDIVVSVAFELVYSRHRLHPLQALSLVNTNFHIQRTAGFLQSIV